MLRFFNNRRALYGTDIGTIIFAMIFATSWSLGVYTFGSVLLETMAYRISTLAWTPVEATVVEQKIETSNPSSGEGARRTMRVIARYSFNGESYIGPEATHYWARATQQEIDHWRNGYPPGTVATLYVNPSHPSQGTWQRGPRRSELQLAAFLNPFFGAEIFMIVMLWRWLRGLRRNQIAPGIFIRSRPNNALEITWHDADPVLRAFLTVFGIGILFALLAQAFANLWMLTLIWLTPIAAALGVFVYTRRKFWKHAERLRVEPRNRIQSFSPPVAISKLDIDSIVFDVTADTSGEDTEYKGHICVIPRDGGIVLIAILSAINNSKMQTIRTRMMAEWISNQLDVPCGLRRKTST
jgi:hypothetical protein